MEETLISIAHSPDQRLQLELLYSEERGLAFRILYDGSLVISSSGLGIRLEADPDERPAELLDHSLHRLPFGGQELLVSLSKKGQVILVRLFVSDNGIAFRYEVKGRGEMSISGERTVFHLGLDASVLSAASEDEKIGETLIAVPALLEFDNGLYMSISRITDTPEESASLRLTEWRRLYFPSTGDLTFLPGADAVTPWWVISFTQP